MSRGAIVLLACAAASLVTPAPAYGDLVAVAGVELAKDPLYVDHRVRADVFGKADARRVRRLMRDAGAGRVYVAVLAAFAPGDRQALTAEEMARGVAAFVREDGTYAVFVGEEFAAVSTELERGVAGRLAARSVAKFGDEGVAATLTDFLIRLGPRVRDRSFSSGGDFAPPPRAADSDEDDDDGSPVAVIAGILGGLALAAAGYLLGRRRGAARNA